MKAAANAIAIVAWIGFLATLWYPFLTGRFQPLGLWLAIVIFSFLVAVIVPSFLLGLEARVAASVLLPKTRGARPSNNWPRKEG